MRGRTADLALTVCGVAYLEALTRRGERWIRRHVMYECWQLYAGSIVCEPSYGRDIIEAARTAGLRVKES